MSEYFLVYDTTSGAVLWRGSGIAGTAELQELDEGQATIEVPADVWQQSPLPLAPMQDIIWEHAKAWRLAARNAGCMTPVGKVDTDINRATGEDAYINIMGVYLAGFTAVMMNDTISFDFTMFDDSVVTLEAQEAVAMGQSVIRHVAAIHERGRALRTAIYAAATIEDLLAIDLSAGWPSPDVLPAP